MRRGEALVFGLHPGASFVCLRGLELALLERLAWSICCVAMLATMQVSDEILKSLIQSIPAADRAAS